MTRPELRAAVAAIAVWLICFSCLQQSAQGDVDAEREVIVIRGNPMTVWPPDSLRTLGFDVPRVPREENAFWVYLEAVNAYKELPEEIADSFDYAVKTAWPAGHDKALKAFLLDNANQQALKLFRKAAAMNSYQPYYFGDPDESVISMLLPGLSRHRQLAKMLVADGRRLEAQGAMDKALDNYVAAMRYGRHAAQGITLIDALVGIGCWTLGDMAVQQLVLNRDLTEPQLRKVHTSLEQLYPTRPTVERGVTCERAFGLTVVDEWATRPTRFIRNLTQLGSGGAGYASVRETTGWSGLEARVGRLILPDRTVKKHMKWYYDKLVELAGKPAYDPAWREFDDEASIMSIPRWNLLARIMMPSLTRACTLGERCRMQSLATRLATSLRLYAKQNRGRLPQQLADLHELIPPEDLINPFSGKEFVYSQSRKDWAFYSFSENLLDDGGKTDGPSKYKPDFVVRFPPSDTEPFEPGDAGE